MAIQGEIYKTVDASVVNGGISTMALSGDGGRLEFPVPGLGTIEITVHWMYDPETDKSGFSGTSWYGTDEDYSMYSPVPGKADDTINTELSTIYDSKASNPAEAEAAVREYVQGMLEGWPESSMVTLAGAAMGQYISAGEGCFKMV